MVIVSLVVWWCFVVGIFNTLFRALGFTYGGTAQRTALFYLWATALTLILYAPMVFSWEFISPFNMLILSIILGCIAVLDWEIAQTFSSRLRVWVWNTCCAKYADILFQQLMIFLLITSISTLFPEPERQVTLFASIFILLHIPVFFIMPYPISWVFLIASMVGGFLFPTLFLVTPTTAPFAAFAVHALFYSVLRAFEHHSDVWVKYMKKD